MTINRKVWACAAAGILGAALGGASRSAEAGIINTETGEDWHPSFDENGNPDPPPDWVNSQWHASTAAVVPSASGVTVLATEDICQRPISDWTATTTPTLDVADAITNSNVRQSFIAALAPWATHVVEIQLAGLGWWIFDWYAVSVSLESGSIDRFTCPTSSYSLADCLREGHDMWYCKLHASLNTKSDASDLELEVPMTINFLNALRVNGTVTLQASIVYRASDDLSGFGAEDEACIQVRHHEVTGFGVWNGTMNAWLESTFIGTGGLACGVAPGLVLPMIHHP